jgi:hypothetical protein
VANSDTLTFIFSPPPSSSIKEGRRVFISGISSPDVIEGGALPELYVASRNNRENTIQSYAVVSPPASASAFSSASAVVVFETTNIISDPDVYAYGFSKTGASAAISPIYPYEWEAEGGEIEITTSNQEINTRYALEVFPSSAGPIKLKLSNIQMLLGDNSYDFSFNAKMQPNSTSLVKAKLSIDQIEENFFPVSAIIFADRYSSIRSNVVNLPGESEEPFSLSIELEISNHGGNPFYFTLPHLINDELFYNNTYVNQARNLIPDFYWEIDSQQESPKFPMFRLMDCLSVSGNDVYSEYQKITPYENSELSLLIEQSFPYTQSTMVDPTIAEERYIPWLSQFNGTNIKRNIKIEDGSSYFPSTESENSFMRWQLSTASFGRRAGSRSAIIDTVRQFLDFTKDGNQSTKSVALSKHFAGNVFKIRIQTLLNETPDVEEEGQSSQLILDAVEHCRPLGYELLHNAVEEFEFTVGDDVLGVIGAVPIGNTEDGFQRPFYEYVPELYDLDFWETIKP